MTTAGDGLKGAVKVFTEAGIDTPAVDAWQIVQHVMQWSRAELLMHSKKLMTDAQAKDLNAAIERRLKHEPVSRIIGTRAFWKSEFKVTPDTLDPRQDSETLIEAMLKYAVPRPENILDLGTGTGCLLLSLLMEFPAARGTGVDISAGAAAVARENAAALSLSPRANFVESNWEDFAPGDSFDSLITNPPYIAPDEIPGLAPEVTQYDPMSALVGGTDGLDCYRSIAKHAPRWLKPGAWAVFEIGYRQANAVKSILAEAGFTVIQTVPDLAGNDRAVVARMP